MAKKKVPTTEQLEGIDFNKIEKILRKGNLKNQRFEISEIKLRLGGFTAEDVQGPRICLQWETQTIRTTGPDGKEHVTLVPVCKKFKDEDD